MTENDIFQAGSS